MDDQRTQQAWEVTKSYIDKRDASRGPNSRRAIETFQAEGKDQFMAVRGTMSRRFYFETAHKPENEAPKSSHTAANQLALMIQGQLRQACSTIPLREISEGADPLYLPSRALISIRDNMDYTPLCLDARLESGSKLPPWLILDAATGRLRITTDHTMSLDLSFNLHLKFYEGSVKIVPCTIAVGDAPNSLTALIKPIFSQLNGPQCADLDERIRWLVRENLAQIYDSVHQVMFPCSLGKFVEVLTRCQNMLRAHTVANLVPMTRQPSRYGNGHL